MIVMPEKFSKAPFPYFGGKHTVLSDVWARLGKPRHYIEPFCGSAAMLLGAPQKASLEVINDQNFYIANFWRCIKFNPIKTYEWQDYPVSHVDLDARHRWLTDPERRNELQSNLLDPDWPGDPKIAGWWVWGQCAWIGSGWCEKEQKISDAGRGVQSQIPHISDAGQGVQSQIPHISNAGRGVLDWFLNLANRLEKVRVVHGDWSRCLNNNYGGKETAVFLDPPYKGYESLYIKDAQKKLIASEVEDWCKENQNDMRIALCGHDGDYDLPGWELFSWTRAATMGGTKTADKEIIMFSPTCQKIDPNQQVLL
jgi:hypothetical protein